MYKRQPTGAGAPTTCVIEDLYLLNGAWYALRDDASPWLPALAASSDAGAADFAPRTLSRAAVDDLAGLGVAARDAAVGDVVLYERYGDDAAHPGHVLTAFGLAIHWAATLVGWEAGKARLLLTDARPAYDADAWLEAVCGPEKRPLYRHELETKVCPRGSLCRVRRALVGFRGLDWNAWRTEPAVFAPLHRSFAAAGRRLMGRGDGAPRRRRAVGVPGRPRRRRPRAEGLAEARGGGAAGATRRRDARGSEGRRWIGKNKNQRKRAEDEAWDQECGSSAVDL